MNTDLDISTERVQSVERDDGKKKKVTAVNVEKLDPIPF